MVGRAATGTDAQDSLILEIVGDLMNGLRHNRQTIAKRSRRTPQTADRWIRKILSTLPGAKTTREGNTTWVTVDTRQHQPTKRAAVGACVAASLASIFAGSQHERNLRDARDYLLNARGLHYEDVDRKFFFAAKGGDSCLPDKAGELDEVIDALLDTQMLEFSYRHNNGHEEQVLVKPLCLTVFDHQFYLLASREGGAPYAYRISRMSDASTSGVGFPYPPKLEFDPEVLFGPLFGIHLSTAGPIEDVEVLLSEPWAAYAQGHKWHPSQINSPAEGPGVLVQLRVRVCPELETWVLGFGECASVQKPGSLIEKVKKRVEANYRSLFEGSASKRSGGPVKASPRSPGPRREKAKATDARRRRR